MTPLSRDAIFAVLSGLTALACDKAPQVAPEPAPSAAAPAASPSPGPAPSGAAGSAPAGASAGVKEVAPATGKPAEKEKTCSPGGCAPGQCGAKK